ncbi:MAG: hypothetical protein ACT443_03595 [Gemmatimonadota bacterium]
MTPKFKSVAAALACALVVTACVKREVITTGAIGPSLLVEQFMRAANTKDLDAMARLFGTIDGPVADRWPKAEVEKRMFLIATELQHEDFKVASEQMVPGRSDVATRLIVDLKKSGRTYNVPFTLVRYKDNSWLVEQIGIEVITAPRG